MTLRPMKNCRSRRESGLTLAWATVVAAVVSGLIVVGVHFIEGEGSGYSSQLDACQQTWAGANTVIANSGMSQQVKDDAYINAEYADYCCERGLGYDPVTKQCVAG